MRFKTLLSAAFAALLSATFSSCGMSVKDFKALSENEGYRDSEKWGKVSSKTIDVNEAISTVVINGSAEINLTQGDSTSINVLGNEKVMEGYDIIIENGKLVVKKNDKSVSNMPRITLNVVAPCITDITVNGAGDLNMESDYRINEPFKVNINGAGDFEARRIESKSFIIDVKGAGDVEIKNIVCEEDADIIVSGAGDIKADIKAKNVKTSMSGAGDAKLSVKCTDLDVSIAGAGSIELKGECRNFRKNRNGVSSIDSRDLKYDNKE